MDLRRLEIFYRVALEASFTRAAQSLSLTQPTVSEAVRLLEVAVDTQLLNRQGRRVVPTAAGKILCNYAQKIFRLRQAAVDELKALHTGDQGALLLGGSTIPGTYLLPSLIALFGKSFPNIRVSLRLASTQKIVDELLDQRLELALVGGQVRDKRLEAYCCFGDELVVIVPVEHSWAGREELLEEELTSVPLLLREVGSASRKTLESHLKDQGVAVSALHVLAEVGGNEALKQGVLAGLGVAVISKTAVAGELQRKELKALRFAGEALTRKFYLLQAQGLKLSLAAERFKALLLAREEMGVKGIVSNQNTSNP